MPILTTLGFALFCLQSIDGPATQDWSIKSFRWSKAIPEGKPIVLKNIYGNIRTRFSEKRLVELSASIQKHKKDPDKVDIAIELKDDALWVEVRFVPDPKQKRDTAIAGMDRRRVDLTVFIPEHSFLKLETKKGLIEAKGLKTDVEARSDRGDIRISTRGRITALAQQGNIEIIFKQEPKFGPYRLETVWGDILVRLPRDTHATIHATTRGLITSDYSLEIKRDPKNRSKIATAIIGKGEQQFEIKSQGGNLKLLATIY